MAVTSHRDSSTMLLHLPAEIFLHIMNFVHPGCHLDVACVCKSLAFKSQKILARHRKAFKLNRRSTHEQDNLFPKLLYDVLYSPIDAWHMRSFTSLGTCPTAPGVDLPRIGRRTCEETFEEIFGVSGELLDDVQQQLHGGRIDGPLKLLMYSLNPYMRNLRFETTNEDVEPDAITDQSLSLLEQALTSLTEKQLPWPTGLRSLKTLAVGVISPQFGDVDLSNSPRMLAAFLTLPNLESVYFRGMQMSSSDDRRGDIWTDIFANSSNRVRDFYLDDPGDPSSGNLTRALCSSFRQLQSFTVRGGPLLDDQYDDFDFFPSCLKIHNAQTLEKLVLYTTRRFHGYRCTMYRPEALRGYHCLKQITIDINDVLLDAYYNEPDDDKHKAPGHIWVSDHDFFVEWLQGALPRSLEVLVFQCSWDCLSEADADYVDDGLVAMIESGNFPAMKAVYLAETESPGERTKCWFRRTMASGVKHGIDVHTKTNKRQPCHKIDFPMPPNADEEQTFFGKGTVFDPYSGQLQVAGCGNCGKCTTCFKIYPQEVWNHVNSENQD